MASPPSSPTPTGHAKLVLKNLQRGARKKDPDNALQEYIDFARWIPLGMNPFLDLGSVIYAGLEPTADNEDLCDQFQLLIKEKPRLRDVLYHLNRDPTQLERFIQRLQKAIWSGRVDDTSRLKSESIAYILPNLQTELNPKIPTSGSKACRGFRHRDLARMLCPSNKLQLFDTDPEAFMTAVQEGKQKITAKHFPTFLYDIAEMDKNDVLRGFLRGYYLVRVYRHIFTSPTSAMTGIRSATKPSKASINSLGQVTGRTLAYAAVQARFAISSVDTWNVRDGPFDYEEFFFNIVALFEEKPDNPWVAETLDWWDKQLPALKTKTRKRKRQATFDDDDGDESEDNGVDQVRKAMQGRMPESSSSSPARVPRGHEPQQEHLSTQSRRSRPLDSPHSHSFGSRTPSPTPSPTHSPPPRRLYRRKSRSEEPQARRRSKSPTKHHSKRQHHQERSKDSRSGGHGESSRHFRDVTNRKSR